MHHFCTYFDRNYLAQGLTLCRSLTDHAGPFTLWVLCFDDITHEVISGLNLSNVRPVSLQEFEGGDEALLKAKRNRSRVEYYFTCTPSWLLYLVNHYPQIERITYLDADLLFYAPPSTIFEELGDRSILIVGHRFPERLRHLESQFGIYNVGLLAFRNDPPGKGCLQWWRDRCLEWCSDRPESGRFADQKYLDDWPIRFEGVVVVQNKGAGLAPWNHMNYMVRFQDDTITEDGLRDALLFANNFMIVNRADYGLENKDLAVIVVVRHLSTAFGYNNEMWAKYGASMMGVKEASKVNARAAAMDSLSKQGVQFAVCAMATRANAGSIARAVGGTTDAIFAELTANLVSNARMVPAGIVAVSRAQERGFSLVSA